MLNAETIMCLIGAYLLGSVPSAVWVGKRFFSIDVREFGSGNAGATNTFRVLGSKAGIPVLLMDIAKGFIAVQLVHIGGDYLPATQQFVNFKLALGIAALFGHIFPVFAGFRGGKGVATLLGVGLGVHHEATLICLVVFILVLFLSKYVSLGSMLAALCFPLVVMLIYNETILSLNIFAMTVSILTLVTHQKNIERLLRGTESKVGFLSRKG
ncbi:MAG TPA: glycerol-3-phosphate 1-O-acyltransferase PlsY [Bacteroidia bacterium]|nr:glycerol-3-phosphate 1-O-acyltransferase PlsY [Bacteroidia bacterium]HNT79928.1 glycerol-3-phosphate 1-O-acyltransferase PlsY [Bacteroidia bacterium]